MEEDINRQRKKAGAGFRGAAVFSKKQHSEGITHKSDGALSSPISSAQLKEGGDF